MDEEYEIMKLKSNKIIAIPFAGGNKYSFIPLQKKISSGFDWITLELPGRGSRIGEELLDDVDSMVDNLMSAISSQIENCNYILFGHSMGSLLGYELTKRIVARDLNTPSCLFFTGHGAPSFEGIEDIKSTLPENLFWERMEELGGLPKEILASKELLEMYYPIMKSDVRAIEEYVYKPMDTPFQIPVRILMGTEEIGEGKGLVTMDGMHAWQDETSSECSFEILEGDHFFIFEYANLIAQKIHQEFYQNKLRV